MSAAVKTVLFVDYDSLYLSLRARDPGMARRFASRPGAWIEAIESGLLVAPSADPASRRRILMRRCYADPKLIGKARSAFQSHGFQIIDCPPLKGRDRNSAEIHMVLDTIDALGHQTGFEEFILLSADSDLTPVIFRLRSYNRSTVIYSTMLTPPGYRAVADGTIDEAALMSVLLETADAESPEADEPDEDSSGRPNGERDDLATVARRVHQATNVPLFPPRVYAELFRALAHEIAENGYHFQATAENVAARLIEGGRNASRRQVAFVVKGLALKGHVFSVTDTPERLAEVFREQVLYLARNAGLEVDDAMEVLVKTWIAGRSGAAELQALPPPEPAPAPQAPVQPAPAPVAKAPPPPAPQPAPSEPQVKAPRPIIVRASEPPMPQPIRPIAVKPLAEPPEVPAPLPAPPVRPAAERSRPSAPPQPPAIAEVQAPQPPAPPRIATPARPVEAAQPQPEVMEPVRPRTPIGPPRPRAARPVAPGAEQPAPVATPNMPVPARSTTPSTIRPPARRAQPPTPPAVPEAPKPAEADKEKDPIESSILAAIAEAVDVLVVEEGTPPAAPAPAPAAAAPEPAPPPPMADDGDIGDEIQRILAAYSQNRRPGK